MTILQPVKNYKSILEETLVFGEENFVERDYKLSHEKMLRINKSNLQRLDETIQMISDASVLKEGAKILEIGVGYGAWIFSLGQIFKGDFEIYATEHPDRDILKNPIFIDRIKELNIEVRENNLVKEELPFDDESFDLILFTEVIEHLPPVLVPDVINGIAKKLKKGGNLLISSNNRFSLFHRLAYLIGRSPTVPCFELDYAPETFGHIKFYCKNELELILNEAGLSYSEFNYSNYHMHDFVNAENKLKGFRNFGIKVIEDGLGVIGFPQFKEGWIALVEKRS